MGFELDLKVIVDIKEVDIYHKGNKVLEQVNFQMAEAEFVYLVGKSGSGKSSFVKSLYGVNPAKGKKYSVLDHDLLNISPKELVELRRSLGIVFQEFYLFQEWSVFQNLEFVLKVTGWNNTEEIQKRIGMVVHAVNLDVDDLNKNVNELSGGQKQKLAIARAMLNNAKVIVADEPTGNLDPESSIEILRLLHQVAANNKTSILFATHDTEIMKNFPARTIQCINGKLVER